MATRSSYRVIEKRKFDDKTIIDELVLIHVHSGGYPDGHPLETAQWLSEKTITNGISLEETKSVFNGASCLAAQLVSRLKGDSAGNTYIESMKYRGQMGEDYLYDIIVDSDDNIEIIAYENYRNENPKIIFKGSPLDYVMEQKLLNN